jgi:hypothetical protein
VVDGRGMAAAVSGISVAAIGGEEWKRNENEMQYVSKYQ